MNHPLRCPCDVCLRIRSDIAAALLALPVERRRAIALEAVALSMPRLVLCTVCSGRCVVPMPGGKATVVCVLCGGRGRHVEGAEMPGWPGGVA